MSKVKIKVNKKDIFRPLITETTPYETPIIFSNDGFYENIKLVSKDGNKFHKEIVSTFFEGRCSDKLTKPYVYKINKSVGSLRTLSLIHPISQKAYSEFYNKFDQLILHFCGGSKTSIRSPKKVGSSYFLRSALEEINKYRRDKVDLLSDDLLSKYASSYFAYSGYGRLYKFLKSPEYLALEKKYPCLVSMDISRCFDSIYTHSISWATKSKDFAKDYRRNYMFGSAFDTLIQRSNYDETNGIPIGAEISRIFAEIILESVDRKVVRRLRDRKIFWGLDYVIRRYVDDYYIFSVDKKTQDIVSGHLVEALSEFKLTINESKTTKYDRPFYSSRSAAMLELSDILTDFFRSFIEIQKSSGIESSFPKKIRRPSSLASSFVNRVKSICTRSGLDYGTVSQYIISASFERLKGIVECYGRSKDEIESNDYKLTAEVLLSVAFFFYSVAPIISSSYSIGKMIILSVRFFEINFPEKSPTIKQRIYEHCLNFLRLNKSYCPDYVVNHISLEKINILISMEELGSDYLIPREFVESHFVSDRKLSYFDIVSIIYYIKDHKEYAAIKKNLYESMKDLFRDMSNLKNSSNVAHLFFDVISCPFLNAGFRKNLLRRYRNEFNLSPLSQPEQDEQASYFLERSWFVDWSKIDLYNMLEKKELKSSY